MNALDFFATPEPPSLEKWESMLRFANANIVIALHQHALRKATSGDLEWVEHIALAERVMHRRCIRF
jgi:hypothetical protein